jgi:hypothetical protein
MRRRPIVFALLLCYLPACTTWHIQQGVSPQQLIAAQKPEKVRVTMPDRSSLILNSPSVSNDSLVGTLDDGAYARVAVSDVTQVATRKLDAGRTGAVVIGVGLLAAAIAVGNALSNMCILSC